MPPLLVTYDLVGADTDADDYEGLTGRIEEYTQSAEVQRSVWIANVGADAETVCNDLLSYIRSPDRLFVAQLTGQAAWKNAICGSPRVKEILG